MAESYPVREPFFAYRFCRLLTKLAVANEIGAEACWMLTVIAHQEDAKRYRGPVTYFNEQLMPLCAIMTHNKLIRVRNRAIEAGWLHYEPGGKGKAGLYWCVIPEQFQGIPDGPMDEGTPSDMRFQNESANGAQTETREIPLSPEEAQTERKRSANGNHSNLYPNPNPKEEFAGANSDESPKPKKPKSTVTVDLLTFPPALDNMESRKAAAEWIEYKRSRGQGYKNPNHLNKLLEEFARDGPKAFCEAVNWSIARNYQGIFRPGGQAHGNRGRSGPQNGPGQSYDPDAKGGGTF